MFWNQLRVIHLSIDVLCSAGVIDMELPVYE